MNLTLRHQRVVFGALSVTMLANMALHSPEVGGDETGAFVFIAGIVNSGLNLAILAYWSWELIWRGRRSATADPVAAGLDPPDLSEAPTRPA